MSVRAAGLALLLAASVFPAPVHARTVTVDTTVDSGALSACDDATPNDCSLRGALNAAAAAAEHYDVILPAGTYATTEVTECFVLSGFPNGGTEREVKTSLCLHGDVSIIGAGADKTFIDGNN